MDRRDFLNRCTKYAAVSSATAAMSPTLSGNESAGQPSLPQISLGSYRISRLIVGSNPLNGNSYLGPHMDRHMREYFTLERSVEFLLACEKAGITAHQFSASGLEKSEQIVRRLRAEGSKLHLLCLAHNRDEIPAIVSKTRPVALVHHGGVTDRRFSEGKQQEVRDFVNAVHDQGLMAGVSAHNPQCIQRIADEGWPVDFFMTCFYFLTRKFFATGDHAVPETPTLELAYPFYRRDPEVMTTVIRHVDKPCLAFKILAAGRKCHDQKVVREAFRYAFAHIKPTDGVIVGMYPRFFDEITANAAYTREFARPVHPAG